MKEKNLDLSALQTFFTVDVDVEDVKQTLTELYFHYSRMSLAVDNGIAIYSHGKVNEHLYYLGRFVELLGEIKE